MIQIVGNTQRETLPNGQTLGIDLEGGFVLPSLTKNGKPLTMGYQRGFDPEPPKIDANKGADVELLGVPDYDLLIIIINGSEEQVMDCLNHKMEYMATFDRISVIHNGIKMPTIERGQQEPNLFPTASQESPRPGENFTLTFKNSWFDKPDILD